MITPHALRKSPSQREGFGEGPIGQTQHIATWAFVLGFREDRGRLASMPLVRISMRAACSISPMQMPRARVFIGRVGALVVSVVLGFSATRAAMIEDPHANVEPHLAPRPRRSPSRSPESSPTARRRRTPCASGGGVAAWRRREGLQRRRRARPPPAPPPSSSSASHIVRARRRVTRARRGERKKPNESASRQSALRSPVFSVA